MMASRNFREIGPGNRKGLPLPKVPGEGTGMAMFRKRDRDRMYEDGIEWTDGCMPRALC